MHELRKGRETMDTMNRLNKIVLALLHLALLAISSTATAQTCNDMQFVDVTAAAGITHTYARPATANNAMTGGAVGADVNGDGWLDIFVAQGIGANLLYINNQAGGFVNEAAARGVELSSDLGIAASAADFDNDGDIDLGISNYFGQSKVLVNDGTGNFTQVILLPLPINDRTFGQSWGDVDNDGMLELAIGQWSCNGCTGPQGFIVYKNNAGVLTSYEFRTSAYTDEHVFAPRFADLNGDRLSDIHMGADFAATRLYMNVGGGMFDGSPGTTGTNDMGHTIGDYDKDGDLDIFTSDISTNSGNVLSNNNGQGVFTPVTGTAGVGDGNWGWGASWGDLDHDGDLDLYHVNGFVGDKVAWGEKPNRLFMNNDDGTFDEVANCAGADIPAGSQGRGMHMFDYDNDGDLDIFVVNNLYLPVTGTATEGEPVLLRNDTPANGNHWLKVTMDGTPPMHRNGIGSRVYVQSGGMTQFHEMHASTNFNSQNPGHIAHFGLATSTTANEVRGEWVTGDATVLTDVSADQPISVPSPTATVSSRLIGIGENVTATSNESAPVEWEVSGNMFADPVTASFSSGGTQELKLLVYNSAMTQVVRTELIRVEVTGVAGTPAITSPVPGSTLFSGDVTFSWTTNGANVDDWQLLIGTSMGDNSLYDSGVLTSITKSAIVSGLPEDGSTLHVTLRWTDGGSTSEVNYTYTASSGPGGGGVPMMVSPLDGSTLSGASETFTWSAEGADIDKWRLEIGTVVDGRDIYGKSLDATVTSQLISDLPTDGSTVYVKLKWKMAGVVSSVSYVYTSAGGTPGTPEITSPVPGSTLPAGDVSYAWTGNGATTDDWQLQVGTSVGDNSLYDSGILSSATMSAVVSGLPEDGSTLHVTLRWNDGGSAGEVNYTYTAATAGGGSGVPMMVSPLDGSTLSGASETFTWSAEGADIDKWRLEIGTVVNGTDIYGKSLDASVTSLLISGLPTDGSPVYVELKWKSAGVVSSVSYVYTSGGGTPGTPAITSPVSGSTLPAGDVSFAWTGNGTTTDDWQLQVGTSVGDNSLYDSGILSSATMSAVVSGLPEDGSTLHVTLRWNIGGGANEANYTYTAATAGGSGVPMMLSPLDGSTLSGASETFTWSAEGADVDAWRLEVGTVPGGRDIYGRSHDATVTSLLISGLPTDGSAVYVNLKWKTAGVVSSVSYVYTAATGP